MRLSLLTLGRYIPWRGTPGAIWGGKQRKIPRLTNSRKAAYLDRLLVEQANGRYLSNPYISEDQEASLLPQYKFREAAQEDNIYYNVYETKFRRRFPNHLAQDFLANTLLTGRRFDV